MAGGGKFEPLQLWLCRSLYVVDESRIRADPDRRTRVDSQGASGPWRALVRDIRHVLVENYRSRQSKSQISRRYFRKGETVLVDDGARCESFSRAGNERSKVTVPTIVGGAAAVSGSRLRRPWSACAQSAKTRSRRQLARERHRRDDHGAEYEGNGMPTPSRRPAGSVARATAVPRHYCVRKTR